MNTNTVTGKVDVGAMGKTLIHEHALIGFPGWFLDNRQPEYNRKDAMARVVDSFQQLKDYGVETVVDPCPSDLGRDVEFYAELSQKSGVNLICATGVYYEDAGITFTYKHMEVDEIAETYIREIEEGVGRTGIRPGIIKIATGLDGPTEYEQKVLAAAAKASVATGTPVLSHTEKCNCGHDQIDILTHGGVRPADIIVGHSDGTDNLDYQISLAERGVFVGFDRFGIEMEGSDEVRMKNLKAMCDHGHREQVLMSHDYVNCWLGGPPGVPVGVNVADVLPNWRMTHIFENIIPQLKQAGMTDEDFEQILIDNPRRFFTREG